MLLDSFARLSNLHEIKNSYGILFQTSPVMKANIYTFNDSVLFVNVKLYT